MDLSTILWVALVTVLTLVFLNYPPPEFSKAVKNWLKKGDYFKYKGHDIFYIVENGHLEDDSTLLCIHGFPTSSHDWIKVLDDLKEHYDKVVLVDMLGFGLSDKPKDHAYLIFEQADILEAILESLSITKVHLLSHDYGDTVALELLHRFNNNNVKASLQSLCMLNGGVFPETNFPRIGQKLLLVPFLGNFLSHLSFYRAFQRRLSSVFGENTQPTKEEMMDFYALIRHQDGNIVNARLIDYLNQRSANKGRWVGALQNAKIPVHMIYGPADPVNSPAFVDHYKKTVPAPSIDVLRADIGHYPQLEDPKGVINSYMNFRNKNK